MAEHEILKALHCDIIQGFFYSKPLNKEDLLMFIKKTGVCDHLKTTA